MLRYKKNNPFSYNLQISHPMAESPEVPEAKDPFEKKIALSIAIIAVLLSLIGAKGDEFKTEAIIKTNEASNAWAYFQSKSVKEHIAELQQDILALKPAGTSTEGSKTAPLKSGDYEQQKEEIKKKAEALEQESSNDLKIHHKFSLAEVLLQLAVVLSSIAILTRWHAPWFLGLALALAGVIAGTLAYF
jgi:hypothetical protein